MLSGNEFLPNLLFFIYGNSNLIVIMPFLFKPSEIVFINTESIEAPAPWANNNIFFASIGPFISILSNFIDIKYIINY